MDAAELQGQVALVVGGSGGIGSAVARCLADAGASVAVGYASNAAAAAGVVEGLPGDVHFAVRARTDHPGDLDALAWQLKERWGRLNILVIASGAANSIPHDDLDALDGQMFEDVVQMHLVGPYSTIRALLPLLKGAPDAVIVNMSSISGMMAWGGNVAYCAAKAALDNMTRALARALAPDVRVIGIAPGAVPTGFIPGRSWEWFEQAARSTPLARVVTVEDVAKAVFVGIVHLRSSTGITIPVDGGRHLG